jgi:hypothetical protein
MHLTVNNGNYGKFRKKNWNSENRVVKRKGSTTKVNGGFSCVHDGDVGK